MARQSAAQPKPDNRPVESGFPRNLRPGQIRRGNYCHRYFICANQNRIDPDQTVCLICDRFIPLFPGVDPLAQARVMGYKVGFKLTKKALVFEARVEPSRINHRQRQIPNRPTPGPGEKRCANPKCESPILPATTEFFHRNKSNSDGLESYCKRCKKVRANLAYRKRVGKELRVASVAGEVR